MSDTQINKVVRGQKYSKEAKAEIIEFVNNYNSENGRGGNTAAVKKYGISQITIANWMRKTSKLSVSNVQSKLETMIALGSEIAKLERDLKAKIAKFEALKNSL